MLFVKKGLTNCGKASIISVCKVFYIYRQGGAVVAKNMEVALLYDFYGDMLTDKQRDMIEQYYCQDLSLSEIAENTGISRQGVRDSVKRAEVQLLDMESHLGLAARSRQQATVLTAILAAADTIRTHNDTAANDPIIQREIDRITALTSSLIER